MKVDDPPDADALKRMGRVGHFPPEGRVVYLHGRNGACDVVLHVLIPHGKTTREIRVPLEPNLIIELADAIRCCPQSIQEDARTGQCGAQYPYANLAHAVWHLENPDQPRPCLPDRAKIIDVLDETALPPGDVIDVSDAAIDR